MKHFEQKWKQGADRARASAAAEPAVSPFGFAARVVAQVRAEPPAGINWETTCEHLLGRALAGSALLLLLSFALIPSQGPEAEPFLPPVESDPPTLFWTS